MSASTYSRYEIVKTQTGYKAIADIKAGDKVLSKNEHNGEIDYKTVTAQYSNPYTETVYIHIADAADQNQTLIANKIHPFYTNGRWIEAGSLKAGDILETANGEKQTVQSIVIKTEPLKAYNLTVQDFHTYFVKGKGAETDAVWVHNECDTTPPRGAYPVNRNTPDGKPIYKSYDPKTNSWKDIYRGSDGKWHDYDPKTYEPDMPESIKWIDYSKHKPEYNKSCKEIVENTKGKNQPAKYHPDIDIEKVERDVWKNGIEVEGNTNTRIKIMDMGRLVGASQGVETRYIEVKYVNGEIHGRPINQQEFNNHKVLRK